MWNLADTVLKCESTCNGNSHLKPLRPHPWHVRGKARIITSYSPACVSLGRQGEHSLSLLHPTGWWMNGWFTFDLIVSGRISRRLVIWKFDINYLHSLQPSCLHLEMLFKVWSGDLRKAVTADSTHTGLWFVQLSTQGLGLHSAFLTQCLGTSLAFTLTLNECLCHAREGEGWCVMIQLRLDHTSRSWLPNIQSIWLLL